VPLVWVFVQDQSGMHRDESFFSTDVSMTAVAMIGAYCGRWNLETMFQEMRCFLGLESTRGWCRRTVLRAAPCLFRLYTVVALLYQSLPETKRVGRVEWSGKQGKPSPTPLPRYAAGCGRNGFFHGPEEARL